jgi:phage shock protein PspC (stress-responsive transcriptional regulator)
MSNFSGGSTHRRLQRSRDQRMVAGVAGGLAEYVDVDPLLVRVLLAVLAVFGGVGVLLYAIGWLLLPDAREEHSIAESVIGRGRRGTPMAEGIVLAVIVIALVATVGRGDPRNLALLAVVTVGGVLVYRHLQDRGRQSPDSPPPPPPTVGSTPPPGASAPPRAAQYSPDAGVTAPIPVPDAGVSQDAGATQPIAVQDPAMTRPLGAPGTDVLPTRPLPRGSLATESMNAVNQAAEQLAAERLAAEERTDPGSQWPLGGSPATPPPSAPEPRSRRSPLRRITISLTIVVVGLLIAIDRAGGLGISVRSYLAVALGLIGAGLLIGARWGRARGLALLGIPLTVALLIAASAPLAGGGPVGDRSWSPLTVGAVQHSYNVRAGTARLDLDQVDFAHAGDVTSRVQVGAGTIDVIVPPDVDVTVHGTADAGQLQLLGTGHAGLDVNQTVNDSGADGPGGGHLDLTVQVGVGTVEVHRAAA